MRPRTSLPRAPRSTPLPALALALGALAAAPAARAQDRDDRVYGVLNARPTWIDRPLVTERRHLDLYADGGFEYADYFRNDPHYHQPLAGVGANLELKGGVYDRIEVGGGIGFRFNDAARWLGPERYGRIDREWLPSASALSGTTTALGDGYVTNPYLRVRVGFVDRGPAMIGIEVYNTIPFVPGTYFSAGVGVPVAFVLGHRVRIETGFFSEFILDTDFANWSFQVPLRINFQLNDTTWLGVRSGFETQGLRVTDPTATAIPLGIQGGVRLASRVDFQWQVTFPEALLHKDPYGNDVYYRRFGAGVGVVVRLF